MPLNQIKTIPHILYIYISKASTTQINTFYSFYVYFIKIYNGERVLAHKFDQQIRIKNKIASIENRIFYDLVK